MAEPKLKGCPFCGSKGRYDKSITYRWTAGCCLGHAVSPEFETKEEAANWWNRRHIDKKRFVGPELVTKEGEHK